CVACGLCLPHCPTYRVTGLESASPRGRIAAMRAVESGAVPIDETFTRFMEECVQCRGCEAACPSGVPFGSLMGDTRAALVEGGRAGGPRGRRITEWFLYRIALPHHAVLVAMSWLLLALQRVRLLPKRFGVPPLSARELRKPLTPRRAGRPDAVLFTGCVMDVWQRSVHRAALRVMEAGGATVALPDRGADCCGALHLHAGRRRAAEALARRVMAAIPGNAAIVVDSAGCGAMLKDYGSLLGTDDARAFSARVRDFSEWLVERGVPPRRATGRTVVVQDPCHLRHVQRCAGAVRTVLDGAYTVVETDDDGLCCGAGGAYAVVQPKLAHAILDRKVAALRAAAGTDGPVVVSANPGCSMMLSAAGLTVKHPAELLVDAMEDEGHG
ncbi:MAG TPA: (Fe-S)-binding protein, partial [Acidimicrobiia bacterium]|nr:(Fe-S)-binding protein [Acidimicrobiia bacterium]